MKDIHIGKIIRVYVYNHGISPQWLANKIGCNRSKIYKIYEKKSIDIDLLLLISKSLNYNFLNEYKEEIVMKSS